MTPSLTQVALMFVRLIAILLLINFCHAQDPPVAQEQVTLESLAEQLTSNEFQQRVDAQRQLRQVAAEHPSDLLALAEVAPGVSLYLVPVLEDIFLKNDGKIGEEAEQSLMVLTTLEGPVSISAEKCLRNHGRLRESRARKAIEKLGGEFAYVSPSSMMVSDNQRLMAAVNFTPESVLDAVWLHHDWKGETQDLWHLQRIAHCPDLAVYSIRGNSISQLDLLRLAAVLPGLRVSERGPCLGITHEGIGGDCTVSDVLRGTPAEKAGLRPGDEILALNGAPIRSFLHLVASLQSFDLGDKVELEVNRLSDVISIEVELGPWRGVHKSARDTAPRTPSFEGPYSERVGLSRPPHVPVPERLIQ